MESVSLKSFTEIDFKYEAPEPAYLKLKDIVEKYPVYWADVRAVPYPPRILIGVKDPGRTNDHASKLPDAYRSEGVTLVFYQRDLSQITDFGLETRGSSSMAAL